MRDGNPTALDRVVPLVYDELRRVARQYLHDQKPGHSLQPTALVHEAYVRLVERSQPDWQDRVHFFKVAATMMRQILVDHARTKLAEKRGGHQVRVEFNDAPDYSDERAADLLALEDGLQALAAFDERKARVLELRYFAGLNVEEAAEALGLSVATIGRETRYAEAWLRRELRKGGDSE